MSKLKIYKASAGSGKTHSLTEEYLSLAAQYPDNFKRVLAVTFTNKAAEEMKQRILESLNEIIDKGDKADFYHVFYSIDKKAKETEIIEKTKKIRDNILHNYSYFSLSTIDSFVQKVIKSFTYEIGIESGYRIELDTQKVLSDITEMLYKQIDTDKNLREWLIHFANYKMDEGKNWDFRTEINKLAREIFKEQFQTFGEENSEDEFEHLLTYFNQLNKIKQAFEEQMSKIGQEAVAITASIKVEDGSLGNKMKLLGAYLTQKIIEPKNQDDYLPSATVNGLVDNLENWSNKTAKADTKTIIESLYYQLNPLLNKAIQLLESDFKYYLGANNILSAFHAFGILRKLAALLPEYRSRNNLLLISDTTRILKEIIAGNDAPFIYEKIGNRYHHVLIDEFQDTSGFQWQNFKPLVQNSLAEGQSNLIVGDIKQSIYRWRGGDWSLLLSKVDEEIGSNYIEHKTLETNWRSKKNILDFNNYFFKVASDSLQQLFDNELNAGDNKLISEGFDKQFKQVISRAYADTFQKLPDKQGKLGGRVKIKFYRKNGLSKDWQNEVDEDLPLTIEQLLNQKNYQPGDIAILVRKNSEGRRVANLLLDYQNSQPDSLKYQIISSESLMLINSPIVQIIINAMHYLKEPTDKIHFNALIVIYNQIFRKEEEVDHYYFVNEQIAKIQGLLPSSFFENIEKLRRLTIYEITELLCQIFSLNQIKGQLAYLQTFQDLIADFGQNEAIDLGAFLEWWEEKGKLNSVQLSDQQDALKILSIHKSKGLAFKVVIIPYCDWDLKPSSFQDTILWTSSEIEPFSHYKRFPLIFRKYLVNSIFYKEYYEELLYSLIDALNMLYVAFTRSREELIVMAPFKETNGITSVADLLINAVATPLEIDGLININKFFFAETNLFELKKDYNDIDGDKFVKKMTEKPSFTIENYPTGDWNTKINIQHKADDFFIKSLEYIESKVNYGTLMHEIFSRIRNKNEIAEIIDEFYYAGKINSDEKKSLVEKVETMISRPVVTDWFSDSWEIKTEDAILDISGKIRIPDRVLISPKETLVIDFKFGEYYHESIDQVKEYIELLKKMNYPNVKGYVYYAEKNRVDEIG
ncbi:MAG: UvrD-helicase domain-containing protein [Bacteroidales bacterium]|nr:UvrD-helicase domain-containing protein [Bacteroidales bacterium]